MKIMWYLRIFFVTFVVLGSQGAGAFDLPTFYRAPFFQSHPTKKTKNWTSEFSVRVGGGNTRSSFDSTGHKTPLFNAYGPFKLASLGLGLDTIASMPVTNSFWGTNGIFSNVSMVTLADGTQPTVASTVLALNNLGPTDGNAVFSGRFRTLEVDLELKQNLFWGFYAHVFVPIKDLKVDKISAQNVGPTTVLGQNMNTFITNFLPTILKENGIQPYDQPFKKSGAADPTFSVGWHGYKDQSSGPINTLVGGAQIGILFPLAPYANQDTVFSLPLGYNSHWGTTMQAGFQLGFWNILSLGAQAGSTIFFTEEHNIRMQTDPTQNGWIALEKGHAHIDEGSIWNAGAYVSLDQWIKGFSLTVGYSFTQQEETTLGVKDSVFLSTVVADALLLVPDIFPNDGRANRFVSKNEIVNSDARLRSWNTQTLHFVMVYDMMLADSCTWHAGRPSGQKGEAWGPIFKIEYSYPVAGKFSWATDMIAGTLGVSATFNF